MDGWLLLGDPEPMGHLDCALRGDGVWVGERRSQSAGAEPTGPFRMSSSILGDLNFPL